MATKTLNDLTEPKSPMDVIGSPLEKAARQPLMLGVFLPLQNGGWSQSTLERGMGWSFEYNKRLAQRCDELGFELAFGLSNWLPKDGYGGAQKYRENHLDPFVSAVALSAVTKRIILAGTMHVLYRWHPVMFAKQLVTADHISGGRIAVNVVTGATNDGAAMFGLVREEHDRRYELADEFTRVIKDLWLGDTALTYNGSWTMNDAFVSPRPQYGRPVLLAASSSAAGFKYAGTHSDVLFTSSPAGEQFDAAIEVLGAHVAEARRDAEALGRKVKVIINTTIVARHTDVEAENYYQMIMEHADEESLAAFDRQQKKSDWKGWLKHDPRARAVGGHLHVVGSWDTVADKLEALHQLGFDGVQLTFYDYLAELELFGAHIIPRLEVKGLRIPIE